MAVRLYALTCGWVTGLATGFLEGVAGRMRVPIPSYLIEHPDGLALFDSGLHPDTARDPAARLGLTAKFFDIHLAPDAETVAGRLAALGVDAGRVRWLVNSHLHFDHTGGNALVPNARLVVQRREWEAGHDADLVRTNFYDPKDYDCGHDVLLVDGEHDLFGDGSVVCVPTFGHTPGHQSLRVRLAGGDVVLTADACYVRRTLEELHLPSVCHDREAMLASLHRLRALRDRGARIFYGHDAEFWASVPQGPAPIE
jgi:glyoxylase-like metal-dependent hydrolase (beta-lactamase superfamily II)